MRRRALLTSTVSLAALAGCVNPFASTESYPETSETTSAVADVPCPDRFDTRHTVCSDPPSHGPPVSLTVEPRTLNLNADGVPSVRATLRNETSDQIALPVRELRRYSDGKWMSKTGWGGDTAPTLAAGETMAWDLSPRTHPTPSGVQSVVHEFRPGNWAFTVVVELTPEIEGHQDIELSSVFTVIEAGD